MNEPGVVASPARGHLYLKKRKGEKIALFLSSFAPKNVVLRGRFSGPVPHQPAAHSPHSRLNVMLTYGIPPYTVLLVRRLNCPCCSRITHACVRENCAIRFYGFLSFNRPLTAAAFRTTDAAAVLVLYCKF